MHLASSTVRTLPLAVSTWQAPVGHTSTHAGNGHWRHMAIEMSFGNAANEFCVIWIRESE